MISVLVADAQRLFTEALVDALALEPDLAPLHEFPESGLEAIDAVVKLAPDVTLLDYWMEGMEGPAATRFILSRAPERKVILLCWFHGAPEIREGVASGAAGVLTKDVELENLAEAIRQVHAGHPLLGGAEISKKGREAKRTSEEAWSKLLSLTPRELEILRYLSASGRPEEVAEQLSLSLGTVRIHIENILAKTGARSHGEAVIVARHHGLV